MNAAEWKPVHWTHWPMLSIHSSDYKKLKGGERWKSWADEWPKPNIQCLAQIYMELIKGSRPGQPNACIALSVAVFPQL